MHLFNMSSKFMARKYLVAFIALLKKLTRDTICFLKLTTVVTHIRTNQLTQQSLSFVPFNNNLLYSSGHLVLSHIRTCNRTVTVHQFYCILHCKCSNIETNLSWTCRVSGFLSFEYPAVLQFCLQNRKYYQNELHSLFVMCFSSQLPHTSQLFWKYMYSNTHLSPGPVSICDSSGVWWLDTAPLLWRATRRRLAKSVQYNNQNAKKHSVGFDSGTANMEDCNTCSLCVGWSERFSYLILL